MSFWDAQAAWVVTWGTIDAAVRQTLEFTSLALATAWLESLQKYEKPEAVAILEVTARPVRVLFDGEEQVKP